MGGDLIDGLMRAHLAASALVVMVLLVRRPVRRWAGAQAAYALWLAPLAGAIATAVPARVAYVAAPAEAATGGAGTVLPVLETSQAAFAAIGTPPPEAVGSWLVPIWLAGAGASLAWLGLRHLRCLAAARAGMIGPAVVGVLRPRVVIPANFEERYCAREQALILEHERAHLRRLDPQAISLALLLRSFAWFNPLAYLAVAALRIDQELACDETVMARIPGARRAYAEVLAKSQMAAQPLPLGCYWPSRAGPPVLERLAMLGRPRPGPLMKLAGALVAGGFCATAGAAVWAATPAEVRFVQPLSPPAGAAPALPPPPAPKAPPPRPRAAEAKAAAAPAAPTHPPLLMGDSLKTGATKVAIVEAFGPELQCAAAGALEVPAPKVEICRRGGVAVMLAKQADGAQRVIAYAVRDEATSFERLSEALPERYGAPTRRTRTDFGESLVWMQGGRQVSLRAACAPGQACVEVSQDMTARRLARSAGMFVAAVPGT